MDCDIPCPYNCRYKTCHIQNGTCFGCEAGYKGTICATGMFCFAYLLMKDNYQYYFYYFVDLLSGSFYIVKKID